MIGGDNLPSPVRLGLTDLQKIGEGDSGPPGPPGSGTTAIYYRLFMYLTSAVYNQKLFQIKSGL